MCRYDLHAKNVTLTEGMKEAVQSAFYFLDDIPTERLSLTVECSKHKTIQLKAHYHGAKKQANATILCDDFYEGLPVLAKKIKRQLKHKHRQTFPIPDSSELNREVEPNDEPVISRDIKVPIYTMTEAEALDQMEQLGYHTLIYVCDTEPDAIFVLVRQADGTYKKHTGLYL